MTIKKDNDEAKDRKTISLIPKIKKARLDELDGDEHIHVLPVGDRAAKIFCRSRKEKKKGRNEKSDRWGEE